MRATSGLFVVIALALTTGCGGSPTTPPGGGLPRLPDAGNNIGGRIKEGAGAAVAALQEKRDQLLNSMKPQMEALDKKVDELKKKAATATGADKQKIQDQIEAIGKKREDFEKKVGELKEAAAGGWDKAKDGVEQAMKDLQDAAK
jgi:chromosome segregation ATPase